MRAGEVLENWKPSWSFLASKEKVIRPKGVLKENSTAAMPNLPIQMKALGLFFIPSPKKAPLDEPTHRFYSSRIFEGFEKANLSKISRKQRIRGDKGEENALKQQAYCATNWLSYFCELQYNSAVMSFYDILRARHETIAETTGNWFNYNLGRLWI